MRARTSSLHIVGGEDPRGCGSREDGGGGPQKNGAIKSEVQSDKLNRSSRLDVALKRGLNSVYGFFHVTLQKTANSRLGRDPRVLRISSKESSSK